MSFLDDIASEIGSSGEKSTDFPNVSFGSNFSFEQFDCKLDVISHFPVEIPSKNPTLKSESQKGEISADRTEQLNISYDSNDSIQLYDLQRKNAKQTQKGIIKHSIICRKI